MYELFDLGLLLYHLCSAVHFSSKEREFHVIHGLLVVFFSLLFLVLGFGEPVTIEPRVGMLCGNFHMCLELGGFVLNVKGKVLH